MLKCENEVVFFGENSRFPTLIVDTVALKYEKLSVWISVEKIDADSDWRTRAVATHQGVLRLAPRALSD